MVFSFWSFWGRELTWNKKKKLANSNKQKRRKIIR